MLYYDEVFVSIQGESTDSGLPCVFVRLFGCNVQCSYCDTIQSVKDRKKTSVARLVEMVNSYHIKNVCITGGEPLIQQDTYPLIYELISLGCKVAIETNGCVAIDKAEYNRSYKFIMDVKCPSSGVAHRNVLANLGNLLPKDEIKFVIADADDYIYARKVLRNYPTMAKILFSPMFNDKGEPVIGQKLIDWVMEDHLFNVRLQIQLHKVLGVK